MAEDQQDQTSIPVVYVNNVRLAISFSDFRLFLGEAIPNSPSGPSTGLLQQAPGAKVVDRLAVVISPDLIPSLVDGLARGLQAYQAQFGSLRTPPQQPQPQQGPPSTPQP
jgi:hypothetical protein